MQHQDGGELFFKFIATVQHKPIRTFVRNIKYGVIQIYILVASAVKYLPSIR